MWLEQWLQRYQGSLLLISHDRDFIDSVCEGIVHIEHKKLNTYKGNYSAFERQRAERLAQQQANYEKQQLRRNEIHNFVNRFRAKATKAKQAQSRLKELERMEEIAPAHIDSPFDFTFPEPDKFSDPLLNLSHADLGYDGQAIVYNVNLSIHPGSRIGLLGANGAGKSTLIKSLAMKLPLLKGELTKGENLRLGYFSQHQLEALDLDASPVLHLQRLSPTAREQEIRNFLGGFNFHGDMALNSIQLFSGGEKARLALAIVVWQKPNILLLDEPTNHLDLEMCHALTVALQDFDGAVIVVSHDRHLLRNTVDEFLLIDQSKGVTFDGDVDDYNRWLIKQPKVSPSTTSDKKLPNKSSSKKVQRQQAAECRQRTKALTNSIQKVEQEIATTDNALEKIAINLANSNLYQECNKTELQEILNQQTQCKRAKIQQEQHWLELNDQLEALNSQE